MIISLVENIIIYVRVKTSVADPEEFIPDPALNFPSSGSTQKFRLHADPYPPHIVKYGILGI